MDQEGSMGKQGLLATASLGLWLVACGGSEPQEIAVAPRAVETVVLERTDVVDEVVAVGDLRGIEESRVFAEVAEAVRAVPVVSGQRVKRGELLVLLSSDLQAQSRTQSESGLEAAVVDRDAAKDRLDRLRVLVAAGTAARADLEAAEAGYTAAQAQVRRLSAALQTSRLQVGRTRITAPIDGVVTGLQVQKGDLVGPGQPLMTLVRTDQLEAVLQVAERDFLRVGPDMPVRVTPLARPDISVVGKVTTYGAVVDRATRTGLVEVTLDNADGMLVAGSAIRATIEVGRREGVLLAPARSVMLDPSGERDKGVAYVVENDTAVERPVELGERYDDRVEIISGMRAGEHIATVGAHLLRDGVPVRAVEAP